MFSLKKGESSTPQKNRRLPLVALAILVLLGLALMILILRAPTKGTNSNKVAILHDYTSQPQTYENVKVGDKYEMRATNQPIDFIATEGGDVYCKVGENQMKKISLSPGDVKKLAQETQASIEKVNSDDKGALTEAGEVLIAQSGDLVSSTSVNTAGESNNFNDAVARIKSLCKISGEEISPANLPEFTFSNPSEASADISKAWWDIDTEANQLYNINFSRYTKGVNNKARTSLIRKDCINTVARTWSFRMAEENIWHHNPNFGSQMVSKCKWNTNVHLGENLGKGASSDAIFRAFRASPSHWNAIISDEYTMVGVGAYKKPGTTTLYITQNFAGFF